MAVIKQEPVVKLEGKFKEFTSEFTSLLSDYKRKNRRLDKIIKQSDKQQFQMIKLNEELDEHKQNLEQKVYEKTQELHNLNKNLEERVKAEVEANRVKDKQLHDQAKFVQLGELMGNIAHQWRQPLNSISTLASGMQAMRSMGLSDDETENKSLQEIFETTQNLSNIINSFKDFVNQKSDKNNFIMQDLLNTTISIISSSLESNNIKIMMNFPELNIELNSISSTLSQVIINILKNAQDALLKHESNNNKIINIDLMELKGHIVIKITDNASGILDEHLPKIFDPYFTTKHQSQGTGLGLYIARENTEKYLNGKINVSTSSSGTIFTILL